MDLFISVLEQASLFALVALGVYITYKILDFPDLSVDGTFPLGAAISASLLVSGVNPYIAVLASALGGMIAGGVTAFLHVKLKISNLMSGILVMIGLYSINLKVMGDKSNVSLFNSEHIFKSGISPLIIILVIILLIKIAFDVFLKTKLGFLLIAVGDNEQVVTSLGVNKNKIKVLGLMLSNALVALSGGLTAQYQGFADVSMGVGTVVKGLACVIIGVSLLGKISVIKASTLSIIGTVIYYIAINVALRMGLHPNNLNLLTALVIVIALSSNNKVFRFKRKSELEEVQENVEDTSIKEGI
ncbi:MAG: ABC transporter permease [Clostridium sp.]